MQTARIEAELGERLDALRRSSTIALSKAEILAALSEVLAKAEPFAAAAPGVEGHIRSLGEVIAATRRDMAAPRPHDIRDRFIPSVTDELDAVAAATEAATDRIMEAGERIEQVARSLDGDAARSLSAAATAICEACSFQDFTGQQIGKVVGALKEIETRVQCLLSLIGHGEAAPAAPENDGGSPAEADRPGRPRHPDPADELDDIDRLFAGRG